MLKLHDEGKKFGLRKKELKQLLADGNTFETQRAYANNTWIRLITQKGLFIALYSWTDEEIQQDFYRKDLASANWKHKKETSWQE